MLHLSDGRDHGYMWDTGRKLKCDTGLRDGTTVFFMLPGRYDPIPMAVENGTVPVPDEAWHKEGKFIVFLYAMDSTGRYTRTSRTFTVKYAPKPNNYAYTPTEVLDWHTLEKRLEDLEGEGLANAVADYLKENPVEAGATAEEAAQIEQNKTDIATLDRTKLAASELPNAVNEALAQAKASGAFDGEPGKDGQPGADGKDYVLTEADKQEIAQEAAGMVEVPDVDIPSTLPNPNALTFTGAATGTYDGSAPLTVNIPEGGGGGIDVTGAEIGQIIKVSAVDGNGKPTAWEAVDMPKSAQADWNQNDETAADYVKNRPFYTGDPVETVLFDGTVENDEEIPVDVIAGQEYTITLDGVEYVLTAQSVEGYAFVGGESLFDSGEYVDTEPPFFIEESGYFYTANEGDQHTLKVAIVFRETHTIDPKYLPKTFNTPVVDPSVCGDFLIVGSWNTDGVFKNISEEVVNHDGRFKDLYEAIKWANENEAVFYEFATGCSWKIQILPAEYTGNYEVIECQADYVTATVTGLVSYSKDFAWYLDENNELWGKCRYNESKLT